MALRKYVLECESCSAHSIIITAGEEPAFCPNCGVALQPPGTDDVDSESEG